MGFKEFSFRGERSKERERKGKEINKWEQKRESREGGRRKGGEGVGEIMY